jgi:hypothetical protein
MPTPEDIFVDRNIDGSAFEKGGQVEKAIALYEANVADRFDGSYPYDRLRVIYKSRGDFAGAIRVCRFYIEHIARDPKMVEKFRAEIDKLTRKLGSVRSTAPRESSTR